MFLENQILEKVGEKVQKPYQFLKKEISRYILNIWRDIPLLNFQKDTIWQKKVYSVLFDRENKSNSHVP